MHLGFWGCALSGRGAKHSNGPLYNLLQSLDTKHLTSPQQSGVSKLVPLSEKLAAWKLLPNLSPCVERTVDNGFSIQFAHHPMRLNCVVSSSVKLEQVHLLKQELLTLLDKGAIEHNTTKVPEFHFRGQSLPVSVLPFGLDLSPRTFTKCMDAALVPLRLQGICILNYIDD